MSTAPAQPSTEQLLAAFASSLLPLAGPLGIAASALVPAVQQLYDMVTSAPADQNFTVDDLVAIVAKGSTDLARLQADVDKLP
jgi:hypothetical protein